MLKRRVLVTLGALVCGATLTAITPAGAANRADYRDCALTSGLDPDFVQLSGAAADSQGELTVSPAQTHVDLLASESADPGDNAGSDRATATVSAPGVAARTIAGAGVGKVMLTIPLAGAAPGSSYTISWTASFDNGFHACPSSATPQNTTATPFVLRVSPTAPVSVTPAPRPKPRSHKPAARKSKCHLVTRRSHGRARRIAVCPRATKKHASGRRRPA